ncbi:unnamed protein product, partial [Durusdinium trenchii]
HSSSDMEKFTPKLGEEAPIAPRAARAVREPPSRDEPTRRRVARASELRSEGA